MALYIQSNVASQIAQNNLAKTQGALTLNFQKLSSGYRINSSADDAAGLGISKSINAQLRSLVVAERNASDGVSMAQTADGASEQIHSILTRMRELAVQGANGSLTTTDRTNLQTEFSANIAEIERIAQVTTFNGRALLNGAAAPVTFQVGINTSTNDQISVTFGGATTSTLGVAASSISVTGTDGSNSLASITAIDTAIQTLSTTRENFGAAINRFTTTVTNLQSQHTNLAAALSRIQDVDIANETASLSRNQVLSQAGAAVLAQANQAPQLALSLLRG